MTATTAPSRERAPAPPDHRSGRTGGRFGNPGAERSAADVRQLADHPVSLRRIGALFTPFRARIAVITALIVASSAAGLATPFITRELFDHAIPERDVPQLLWLVGGLLAVAVVTAVLGVAQTYLSTAMGQRIMHGLRTSLFDHMLKLPMSFFTRTRGGELQSRLTNDINGMQTVVTNSATSIASNVTTAVGTAIAMLALSWQLSLLSLVVLPPAIAMTRKVARTRRRITAASQRSLADLQTQIEESLSISGIRLAKTLGTGPALSAQFTQTSTQLTELEVESQVAGRWRMAAMSVIFASIPAVLYLGAGLPATADGMTIGTLVAFTGLQAALFRPLMGVLNVGVEINSSLALFSRIFEYLDLPIEIADPADPVDRADRATVGELRFDQVGFRYPDADRDALSGIDLTVPGGSSVAVVGATGSGKSTLAALVSRLYDPSEGAVRIDGVDLRNLRLSTVSELVGVVSQESYLRHVSIAENLRYGKPDASDEELEAAARSAQIHDLIADLPDGYQTIVGARGYRFSGGEQQRIALARTILRNPPILVLDEATSALDNRTERAVQQAIDAASRGRTTVTIAHRLSTIRDADRIVVLDAGRIVEHGTHEELLNARGRYFELVRAQQLRDD